MKKRTKKKEREYTYVVRKLVRARSAPEAIRLAEKIKVHDVYVDAAMKKEEEVEVKVEAIGFHAEHEESDEEEAEV